MKNEKNSSTYLLIMCLFLYLLMGATSLITPVLADLSVCYADYSPDTVNLIVTLPSLTAILGCLVFGSIIRTGYKRSVIAAIIILVISSIFPFFFIDSIWAVIASRGIVGLAFGFLLPACTTTITRVIAPDKQGTVMGFGSTFLTVVLIILMNLVPVLLKISVRAMFLIHIVLVLPALLMLPVPAKAFELAIPEAGAEGAASAVTKKEKFGKKSWFWQFVMLLNTIFYYPISLYISYVVVSHGGDAAQAALASSVMMVAGAIAGAAFGLLRKKFSKIFMVCALAFMALGFLAAASASSIMLIYVGCFLIGIGNMLIQTNIYATIPQVTPAARIGSANGNTSAFQNIGAFVSPIILTSVLSAFHLGDNYQTIYYISTGFYILGTVLFIFINNKVSAEAPATQN